MRTTGLFVLMLVAAFFVSSAQAAPVNITILNAGFEDGPEGVVNEADHWDKNPIADPNRIYFAPTEAPAGYTHGRALSMMGYANKWAQQTLAGVEASQFTQYTVDFLSGMRPFGDDPWDVDVRVSIWDITNDVELGGQTITFSYNGTPTALEEIPFTAKQAIINVDTSGLSNEAVALRFTHATATGSFTRTALVDNVSMTAIPEPASLVLLGLGGLLMLRRRQA